MLYDGVPVLKCYLYGSLNGAEACEPEGVVWYAARVGGRCVDQEGSASNASF